MTTNDTLLWQRNNDQPMTLGVTSWDQSRNGGHCLRRLRNGGHCLRRLRKGGHCLRRLSGRSGTAEGVHHDLASPAEPGKDNRLAGSSTTTKSLRCGQLVLSTQVNTNISWYSGQKGLSLPASGPSIVDKCTMFYGHFSVVVTGGVLVLSAISSKSGQGKWRGDLSTSQS
ncbi:hypothetical protein RRG08_026087 [Elysia crispata]|uniref:Uncharacterized protein n=1 Tax=Elysia crispata TaxID=231223 RepID=A0AAE0YT39_9GAST|nr:hypothetical protein RRG08_026087 [Elysia crispata]